MRKLINLIDKRFGRLIVLKRTDNNRHGQLMWLCKCDCGTEKIIRGSLLRQGHTKSCGCLHIEKLTKHGHNTKTKVSKTYTAWANMIQRCVNPNEIGYSRYGGRGITVCKRWMKFENFLEDMGEHLGKGYSIDRIDNDGNYCKPNCRWATRKEQARNTRRNLLLTYKKKTQCLAAWAEEFNINYTTLYGRIFTHGWSIAKTLTTPVGKQGKKGES